MYGRYRKRRTFGRRRYTASRRRMSRRRRVYKPRIGWRM
jgi:hypothetical protein